MKSLIPESQFKEMTIIGTQHSTILPSTLGHRTMGKNAKNWAKLLSSFQNPIPLSIFTLSMNGERIQAYVVLVNICFEKIISKIVIPK